MIGHSNDYRLENNEEEEGGGGGGPSNGSGSKLPPDLLLSASLSAGFATLLSLWCILRHLLNYRKPMLQRFVIRILFMVPIYSISSLISLYSLDASFFIDLIRDIYEAFVIYCFFGLLVEYLGGERSLLILLHGREPTPHPWPISKILPPMDISDPYTFLNLKRGILQYVQVKPILVILTVIFKATKTYNDGDLKSTSGYTYVSIAYNFSVTLCLYFLAMFWMCTSEDLKPFRPMPKFLCIKGIIFFSFWQGFGISILVAVGLLRSSRYTTETLSLAIQDTMICFEMPIFALLHLYAFSHKDYVEPDVAYCGRLPLIYAFRDSILGFKDVIEDSLTTLKGTGFSYKTFEPSEGALHHQGRVRERRVQAGLRYSALGKQKYWLPMAGENEETAYGRRSQRNLDPEADQTKWRSFLNKVSVRREDFKTDAGYAPLMPDQAAEVIHQEGRSSSEAERRRLADHLMSNVGRWDPAPQGPGDSDSETEGSDLDSVGFGDPRSQEEVLYQDSRRLEFGDYNNPVVDASKEEARRQMRAWEEGLLANHPAAPASWIKGKSRSFQSNLGSPTILRKKSSLLHEGERVDRADSQDDSKKPAGRKFSVTRLLKPDRSGGDKDKDELPEGCVDLLVEDRAEIQRRTRRDRLKGEANRWTGEAPQKVYKVLHPEISGLSDQRKPNGSNSSTESYNKLHGAETGVGSESEVEMVIEEDEDLQAEVVETPNQLKLEGNKTFHDNDDDDDDERYQDQKRLMNGSKKGSRRDVSMGSSISRNPWE